MDANQSMLKLLTQEQINKLEQDGFVGGVSVMTPEEANAVRQELNEFSEAYPDLVNSLDFKANHIAGFMDRLGKRESILDAVEDVAGEDILLWNMSLRDKKPDGTTHAAWHQDDAYMKYLKKPYVICWLALTDVTEENGCLEFIPGSHNWGDLTHKETQDETSILSATQSITDDFDKSTVVNVPLRAGEMAMFHYHTAHKSGPNTSTDNRIGIILDYIPCSMEKTGERFSGLLVRGTDNYDNWDHETVEITDDARENIRKQEELKKRVMITKTGDTV